MGLIIIDQFIVNTFFASSLIGLLLLFFLRLNKQKKLTKKKQTYKIQNNVVLTSANNGRSLPEYVSGPDVIIVGAGVAGAALAHTLAKDGRRVHVIERDLTEPDRIVGELLQPGGYLKLVELGLEDCVEEIDALPVVGYALFKNGQITKSPYPLAKLPANVAGRSFHNGRFIQRMRQKASSLPNVKMEEATVTSLIEENAIIKGVHYKTKDGQELRAYAPLTIVCDGCFSNLRRSLGNPKVDIPSCFVGLVLENCQLPVPNHGHVVLADPSPILFYPISSTEVRCLVDIPGQNLPSIANGEMAKYLKTKVAPQIPDELRDAFISTVEKGNIRTMTNRNMPAVLKPMPGALLMGDAFNMRHPLTGSGMTVALFDVVMLRNLMKPLRDFHDATSLNKCLQSFYISRKPVASIINALANSVYQIFSASSDEAREEMRQASVDYLGLGGIYTSGAMGLLACLNLHPSNLIFHLFAMAIFGVGRLLLPFPSPRRLWIGAKLIWVASEILFPIMKAEGVIPVFYRASSVH